MNVSLSNRLVSIGIPTFLAVSMLVGGLEARAEHHVPGRLDPYNNCRLCHGDDLQGGIGRSCYTCHGRVWPGGDTPPIADVAGPYAAEAGETIQFDGSGSSDVDGVILSYLWDFGDGSVGAEAKPTHTYDNAGVFSVTLTVTDDNGHTDSASTVADVTASTTSLPPLAVAGGPYTGAVGNAIQFDGSGSIDVDGSIVSYEWDFGDGSNGDGAKPTHVYTNVGIFAVLLTVTDNTGASNSAETVATVLPSSNSPPIVDPGGPYSGLVGQEIQFDASNTVDPDGDTLIFLWDFGDGSLPPFPSQSPLASHAYSSPGEYTVQVVVSDGSPTPVIAEVLVEISDDDNPLPPLPLSESWNLRIPLQNTEFVVSFYSLSGFLWVQTTHSDGNVSLGIGFELDGMVIWMDMSGAIFVGTRDPDAGTMMGLVFDNSLGNSMWLAEKVE